MKIDFRIRKCSCCCNLRIAVAIVAVTWFLFLLFALNTYAPYVLARYPTFWRRQYAGSDTVVNPHNFSYVLDEPDVCSTDVFLFIFVHTAPDHFKQRAFIRKTWGARQYARRLKTATLFLMGRSLDERVQSAISYESERYRDIMQEDYIDTYRNLTYKVIGGLKWVSRNCLHSAYVLKSDDDMVVDVFALIRFLETNRSRGKIMCKVWEGMHVMRRNTSKWHVTRDDFDENVFPPYCSGSAYLLPTKIVPRLYEASFHTRFFWVDDVYATGFLNIAAKIKHWDIKHLYVFKPEDFEQRLSLGEAMFTHLSPTNQNLKYAFWKRILEKERAFENEEVGWLSRVVRWTRKKIAKLMR